MIVNLKNINSNNEKKVLWFLVGLMLTSLLVFILGVVLSVYFIFIVPKSKGSVYGYITDINRTGTTASYIVEGVTYTKTYSVHSSNYYVGKKIKILYNRVKPIKSSIGSFRYLWLIMPGISIIFLGVSGILLFVFYKRNYLL